MTALPRFILPSYSGHTHVIPQNCGCGNCTVSQWVTGSAYCPHPKRATVQSVLVAARSEQPRNDHIPYFFHNLCNADNLLEQTYTLQDMFKSCYSKTYDALQRIDTNEDFTRLLDLVKMHFSLNPKVPRIANTHELFEYLCEIVGVSWFNYFPICFLVNSLKVPDQNLVHIWNGYASEFKEYCQERRVKDFTDHHFLNKCAEINNSFIVEINDEYDDDIKLSIIESLRVHISEVLDCKPTDFYLLAVGVGSLLLLFRYYLDDYLNRFRLSKQQRAALVKFHQCNIISLKDVNNKFEYMSDKKIGDIHSTSQTRPYEIPALQPVSNTRGELVGLSESPLAMFAIDSVSSLSYSEPELDNVDVDYSKFKEMMMDETCIATVAPVLITLAGLPSSDTLKTDMLQKVFQICEPNAVLLAKHAVAGITLHELVACSDINRNMQLEYHRTEKDSCYIYAAYAALKHRSRLFKEVEKFNETKSVTIFKSKLLNKSFVKFYTAMQSITCNKPNKSGMPFGKPFDKTLPYRFAYINIWDVRLSKTVFHFLPFLTGQLSNNYLWLFSDVQDVTESDSLEEEWLTSWKPKLYYLLRNVYLTSKVKKTKGKPQCTMILTSDKRVTEEVSQQCMKKVMKKATEMKMEHLVDPENYCIFDAERAGSEHTCSQELKKIGDNIVEAGFRSKAQVLPFSWICLRNAFYENRKFFVLKEKMQKIAEELSITESHFDDFLAYFTSCGSIIDASKFGADSPYIITNPYAFFEKLDDFFYHVNGKIFLKYGLITREKIEEMFLKKKKEADFFIKILLSVNLAFLLQSDQLSIPPSLFPNQPQSVYYIPVANQEICNRECTHYALHLHITAGQVLCRNLQVKFAQTFLKKNAPAKMLIREDKCIANVTSITYAGLSFDIVCHGNEAEFIVNDAKDPKLYKAINNTLYSILKDLAASEPFFSFKFSFLCCKNALVSEYELNQTCHFLPFTSDCKECEIFMSGCDSLKTWNTVLQQDDRWKEFPEFENMKEGLFSPEDGWKFATSLKSLSDDCVDQLAKLLKFDKGIQEDSLKGYEGWKRIMMMILEWENESNFYTWQTEKLFREKLKKLLQHPNTSLEDKEIIKKTLALDYNGTKGEVITELEIEKAVLEKLNEPESVAKVCKDDKRKLIDYSAPVAYNYISPSHIAGRKSYTLQGSKAQMLDWDGYGFMMSFPENTLQHEEDCEVTVLALAGGNFRFPKGTELVSAVFSISFERGISRPVGVYIEHCASLETKWQTTQLRFVATTGKDHSQNKTVFNYIEGGQFEIGNKYGYMERMHFCELGVVGEKDEKSSHLNYTGCLLYETKYLNHWLLKFFVHKDIKAYEQFVTEKCDRSVVDQKIVFKFVDTYIELSLSDSVALGWRLDPHAEPLRLWKSEIDSFGSSLNSPPAACLITIYGKETPTGTEPLHHPITLNGIDCSMKTIFINRSLSEINVTPVNDLESGQRSLHNNLSRQHTDHGDAIKRLVTVIKDVLTTYEARLSPLMNLATISEFVTEMHSAKLIDRAVARNNPSYATIIDQFTAGLVFLMEPSQIEQQCLKFFTILCDIGGPLEHASEAIKADLAKEVKRKLNMDLHFRMQ